MSGVWRDAATEKAAVMPGTISKGIVVLAEEGYLFAGSAEDERVAGFEAEDGAAGFIIFRAGVLEHEGVDASLGDAGLAAALTYGDYEGGGAGEVEDGVGDEIVGEDYVAGFEELGGAESQEGWVAGAGTCEVDMAGLGFGVEIECHPLGSWGWDMKAVRFANADLSDDKAVAKMGHPDSRLSRAHWRALSVRGGAGGRGFVLACSRARAREGQPS